MNCERCGEGEIEMRVKDKSAMAPVCVVLQSRQMNKGKIKTKGLSFTVYDTTPKELKEFLMNAIHSASTKTVQTK